MEQRIESFSVDTFGRNIKDVSSVSFYFAEKGVGLVDSAYLPDEIPYNYLFKQNEDGQYTWIDIDGFMNICGIEEEKLLLPTFEVVYKDEKSGFEFKGTFREFAYRVALMLKEEGYR